MPIYPAPYPPLPPDTNRAAKSVFNMDHLYLVIGDQLDTLCEGLNWEELNSFSASSAHALFINTLVTLFQFAEDIPDGQAADAVRTRMDWKYALHLPLAYPGFDPPRLAEFRRRLAHHAAGQRVCACLLSRLEGVGLLGSRDKRGADFARVLAAVDSLSRVEKVNGAMCQAVEALASGQPEWLRHTSLPHWYERYGQPTATFRVPCSRDEQDALLDAIKGDMAYLLQAIGKAAPPDLATLPEIRALRHVWDQEFGALGPAPNLYSNGRRA